MTVIFVFKRCNGGGDSTERRADRHDGSFRDVCGARWSWSGIWWLYASVFFQPLLDCRCGSPGFPAAIDLVCKAGRTGYGGRSFLECVGGRHCLEKYDARCILSKCDLNLDAERKKSG